MLLSSLPKMRCDSECGECCTIVPVSEREIEAIREYAKLKDVVPQHNGPRTIQCPFFQGGGCAVYPVRPMLCRLYGHSPRLQCPRGYNNNVNPQQEKRINRLYLKQGSLRTLHDAFLSPLLDGKPPRP